MLRRHEGSEWRWRKRRPWHREPRQPSQKECPIVATFECPGCGAVVTVRSSHPITVLWMEREPGVLRGEAVGATSETTKRFSMVYDNGDSTQSSSWPKAQGIQGSWLGEVHRCTVEPAPAGARVSSPA